MKIVDPHLVSSFFDNYKRAYLHTTVELVNKSNWVANCSLNIQVGTELEGDVLLVEHLRTQRISVPAGSHVQYTLPEVGFYPCSDWVFYFSFFSIAICVLLILFSLLPSFML